MGKIKEKIENDEKQQLLQTQDMKLVKALAGNDKKIRDRALRNMKEWLQQRSSKMPFTEDDYLRIWKGLFCTIWMSDKPLVQEECAENIANLIHSTMDDSGLLFFKCGLKLLSIEWFGIDQWRLDKFLMFVRRLLRQALIYLKNKEWDFKSVNEFTRILSVTILTANNKCTGLTMHVTEIYLEELAKVSNGEINEDLVTSFVKPFIRYLSIVGDDRQLQHTVKCIFHHLIQQTDIGLEHDARFNAWRKEGFPGGTIDAMEKMEVDSDDNEDSDDSSDNELDNHKPLDPRAGRVDVELPQLRFDIEALLKLLHKFKFKKDAMTNGKKVLTRLHQQYQKLSEGSYPLGITRIPKVNKDESITVDNSVDRLLNFDQQLRQEKKQFNNKLKVDAPIKQQTKRKKPKKIINGFGPDIFADKLQSFINRSEGSLRLKKKVQKKRRKRDPNWSYEDSFRRNSGLWTVHKLNTTESPAAGTPNGLSPKSPSVRTTPNSISPMQRSPPLANGISPKFKQAPLLSDNTEIFTPSNKIKPQDKDAINDAISKMLQIPSLVKNPFSLTPGGKTPKSEKKVRIALKLNQSQEIAEHEAQIKSSPAIPYDANKKPDKPLLKPNYIKSPINPFYKKKLKLSRK